MKDKQIEFSHNDFLLDFYSTDNKTTYNYLKCEIPTFDVWDIKIKKLFQNIPVYSNCEKSEPLTYVDNRNTIRISQKVNQTHFLGLVAYCQYAHVLRQTKESDNYTLGDYTNFTDSIEISKGIVKVRCFTPRINRKASNSTVYNITYEYVHSIIDRIEKSKSKVNNDRINVMIMIMDSVSLASFQRFLPKTKSFLNSFENFYLFQKHHTIGLNTFENIVPMLVNRPHEELLIKKNPNQTLYEPFDEFPFIWKNFSQAAYVTFFTEEWRESMFNNLKFGFREAPTDHYLRHYWLSLYDSKSYTPTKLNSNNKPCYFNKLLHHLTLEWVEQFQRIYENTSESTFGIFKMNEMSHDYLERLRWIDEDLVEFFKKLFTPKFLNSTLFILMGDHGHRQHPIRHTLIGKLASKLPLYSMMIPNAILNGNEELKNILNSNLNELTTWWDVYETLSHVLLEQTNIGRSNEYNQFLRTRTDSEQRGRSLFTPVNNRSCVEAHIPSSLCSCGVKFHSETKSPLIANATMYLIDYINDVILKNYSDLCIKYKLMDILEAQTSNTYPNSLVIIFKADPNNAVFDASLFINQTNGYTIDGVIERVSRYGISSHCVNNYFLKNYCFCKTPYSRIYTKRKKTR